MAAVITKLASPLGGTETGVLDEIVLTSEERASAHFSAQTRAGRLVRVSLPRGTELQDGDVLSREGGVTIVVRAAPEALLWLTPRDDVIAWDAACYQLGNLHRPARFLDGGVLTPRDPMVLQVLKTLDVSVEEVLRPFTGRRFGAAGAHHYHGDDDHDHHHDHSHDHDHHSHAHHHGGHHHGHHHHDRDPAANGRG